MELRPEDIDWTGFAPDNSPIAPLTPETFVARLNRLTSFLEFVEAGRLALEQQYSDERLSKISGNSSGTGD